jgi:hypothetical protein
VWLAGGQPTSQFRAFFLVYSEICRQEKVLICCGGKEERKNMRNNLGLPLFGLITRVKTLSVVTKKITKLIEGGLF